MTASDVATNSALPSPQPARNPTSSPTVLDMPERAAKTTITDSPISSVFLPPIREETNPVTSMAMAVTKK